MDDRQRRLVKPEDEIVSLEDPEFIKFQERRNRIPMTLKDLIDEELERDRRENTNK